MSWIAVAVGTGAGAGLKYLEAQQAQKQDQAKMMANAAQIQYSPWTHANAQVIGAEAGSPTTAALGGALQGGLSGAMFAKSNPQLMGGGGGTNGATMNNMNLQTNAQPSTLGGSQFSNQIGNQANTFYNQNPYQPKW